MYVRRRGSFERSANQLSIYRTRHVNELLFAFPVRMQPISEDRHRVASPCLQANSEFSEHGARTGSEGFRQVANGDGLYPLSCEDCRTICYDSTKLHTARSVATYLLIDRG
jgi:hypothetical protein